MNMLNFIHEKNPYEGFDTSGMKLDMQGWGSGSKTFEEQIKKTKPNIIFEVGTWKGGSAIHMGNFIKTHGIDCQIVCIDTWLGGIESWLQKHHKTKPWFEHLRLKNGYPSIYYQFLYNVVYHKLEDIIVPFPAPSAIAAKYFKEMKVEADLIYIDGSHDETDAYYDMVNYYAVLKKSGTMFGHDYVYDSIKNALKKFCEGKKIKPKVYDTNFWVLE